MRKSCCNFWLCSNTEKIFPVLAAWVPGLAALLTGVGSGSVGAKLLAGGASHGIATNVRRIT